jgi:hypothetical protein
MGIAEAPLKAVVLLPISKQPGRSRMATRFGWHRGRHSSGTPASPPRVGRRHRRLAVRAAPPSERRRRPGARLVPRRFAFEQDLVHPVPGRAGR